MTNNGPRPFRIWWLLLAGFVLVPIVVGLHVLDQRQGAIYAYNRGIAYGNKGEYDRAIAEFTKAIQLDSAFLDAYISRSTAYARNGEANKAINDISNMVRFDPKFARKRAMEYCNRGLIYARKGKLDNAIDDWTKAFASTLNWLMPTRHGALPTLTGRNTPKPKELGYEPE